MSPPMPWSIMTRAASRETRNEPRAITSCCRSQSAARGLQQRRDSDRPALFTTRSTPPKARTACRNAAGDLLLGGDVDVDGDGDVRGASGAAELGGDLLGGGAASRSATTTQAPSAASRRAVAAPMPEPPPVTSATRVASGLGAGIRRSLASSSSQYSMRNFSDSVDRRVAGQRLGAAHHVDRVDVELAGDPGGLLVLAEAEHADAGHQHDRRVRAAHRRRVRGRRAARSRRGSPRGRRRAARRSRATTSSSGASGGRSSTSGRDLGAQEVVRAGGAERGEPRVLGAGQEVEHDAGCRCSGRPAARSVRGQARGSAGAARRRARAAPASGSGSCETGPNGSGRPCSAMYALGGADDLQRVGARTPRWSSPQAVMPWPPRMHADGLRVRRLDRGDVEAELEAGPPPRHPHDPVAEDPPRSAPGRRRRWRCAMPESGCRWSTCAASTRPCMAVSIDGAAPPLPCRQ